ncbi:holo-ACP synthase [Fusibacter ferrireducens]|uniref:Holo-[acyl-carrier-protein] synthase n=1 Tax=Fusibacter ferrireducens TaxID=2785058 RepID=A0ABR9ZY11_9FIRM|nr:holo-ACP synthase [Fusibacter ferrireducens]MBF4695348.1 holo-ACP synthase [Fusibacter ferrireducens]
MIKGNGVDIVEIERFKKIVTEKPKFLKRFFTDSENELFEKKHMKAETVAGNFATKEAVSKAFGTGVRGFNLRDIEVLRDELGHPYVNLYDGAKEVAHQKGITTLMVSISHSSENAVAFVIAVGEA